MDRTKQREVAEKLCGCAVEYDGKHGTLARVYIEGKKKVTRDVAVIRLYNTYSPDGEEDAEYREMRLPLPLLLKALKKWEEPEVTPPNAPTPLPPPATVADGEDGEPVLDDPDDDEEG